MTTNRVHEPIPGEQFLTGEVWRSPRGKIYKVVDVSRPWTDHQGCRRVATLRDNYGKLRKIDWDKIEGWVRE